MRSDLIHPQHVLLKRVTAIPKLSFLIAVVRFLPTPPPAAPTLPPPASANLKTFNLPQPEASKNSSASSGVVGGGVDATGHVALCITEELWALSGMDDVSDLLMALAKVLTSLPLPEDNQVRQSSQSVGRAGPVCVPRSDEVVTGVWGSPCLH